MTLLSDRPDAVVIAESGGTRTPSRSSTTGTRPGCLLRARPPTGRLAWRLAVAGSLAAVVTLGVFAVRDGLDAAPPHSGAPPVAGTGATPRDAAGLLHLAALAAQQGPSVVPRPDQFVFTETQFNDPATAVLPPAWTKPPTNSAHYLQWNSVDGTHDGLDRMTDQPDSVIYGCRNGRLAQATDEPSPTKPTHKCAAVPAYRADLPTDPGAMLSWLKASHSNQPADPSNGLIYKIAGDLLTHNYLTPASQAAIYAALAKLPGATLLPDAVDGAGRHGLAIGIPVEGPSPGRVPVTFRLVFDRKTYAYLGTSDTALLRIAVVDRVGQLS